MNLPPKWAPTATNRYSHVTDEMTSELRLNLEPDGGWSLRGYGWSLGEATIERLLWSLEPPPDREGLAMALYEAGPFSAGRGPSWDELWADARPVWLSVADTAIQLLGGAHEEVPEGWPKGWARKIGDPVGCYCRDDNDWTLPNTEPGRLAAWKLEGKNAEPCAPFCAHQERAITLTHRMDEALNALGKANEEIARLKADVAGLENDTASFHEANVLARAETRAAISSRDQADQEAARLRASIDLLQHQLQAAHQTNAELRMSGGRAEATAEIEALREALAKEQAQHLRDHGSMQDQIDLLSGILKDIVRGV